MYTTFHYPFICWWVFIWPCREVMKTSGDRAYLVAETGFSAPSLFVSLNNTAPLHPSAPDLKPVHPIDYALLHLILRDTVDSPVSLEYCQND